jgi:hypothetical protein
MKYSIDKLNDLRQELIQITKDVQKGLITNDQAADRIVHVREEMDKVIQRLKDLSKK